MAQLIYTEAIETTLTLPILTTTASSMTVADVSQMPTLTAGDWFYLTLYNNDVGTYETVRITDITGLVLTIERGIDGTIPQTFTVSATAITAWVTGILWEDLRDESNLAFCTANDILVAIQNFLVLSQIQTLIDTSLVPYITTTDANLLLVGFQDAAEIQALIDTARRSSHRIPVTQAVIAVADTVNV